LGLYAAGRGLESAETAEIKDTTGERIGLESGIVAAAGALGLVAVRVRPPMV